MSSQAPVLDEYARSMFRHERLHDRWIGRCARWLRDLFGDSLEGRTVIDYGFGRGNWALAFLEAGAHEVIAIDAAKSNCERLSSYIRENHIQNLEVVHGNVLDGDCRVAPGDIVWLHGVLHHVADPDQFLDGIARLGNDDALFHVYHYDAGSLRELTVETARTLARCNTEDEFSEIAPAFTRAARQRAADDLVAPHIAWRSAGELAARRRRHGLHPVRQDGSFARFLRGWESEEFQPHHFLCTRNDSDAIAVREPPRPWTSELAELQRLFDALCAARVPDSERRLLGVGLMNTHFGTIENGIFARAALEELFLYALGQLIRIDARDQRSDDDLRVDAWIELASAAAAGDGGDVRPDLPDLQITRRLRETAIRL